MISNPFRSLLPVLFFVYLPCSAQWSDNFSDSDFQNWFGDTSHFKVNSNYQLQLSAPATSGNSYLVTRSDVSLEAVWKFWLRLDFNPSSSNYAKVYLMTNSSVLDSSLNGYFVRIGSSNDDISLNRQDGSVSKVIIDSRDGMLSSDVNSISVEVTRSVKGEWKLSCDTTGHEKKLEIGSCTDSIYWYSGYFGVQCCYTSTRSTRFYFDNFDVQGNCSLDTTPPVINDLSVIDDSLISITFSEEIDQSTLNNLSNFILPIGMKIKKMRMTDFKTVCLNLYEPVRCGENYLISIRGIKDVRGNQMAATTLSLSNCPGNTFDVLITEIMADPDPPVQLPNVEYIELTNNSDVMLDLNKWSLNLGEDVIKIPGIKLPSDSFLVICASDGCRHLKGGNLCLDILPKSRLNNSGKYVGLRNKTGKLIHWVNYDESFYHDNSKKNGGWSLEMIDTDRPCAGNNNWKASVDFLGGTPGKTNSVAGNIIDIRGFQYTHIYLVNDSTIRLYFSKPIFIENIQNTMFLLDGGQPVQISSDEFSHLYIDLIFPFDFQYNKAYTLQLSNTMEDCSGEKIKGHLEIPFEKPANVTSRDIVINEVLFDTALGDQEFIELYNRSNKFISSQDLLIRYNDFTFGFDYTFLIPPGSFIVLAKNSEELESRYNIHDLGLVVTTKCFPSLNNEEGCISIMNINKDIIDEFCYSEKMHLSALVNKKGVSLERVHYSGFTSDPENWHSASSIDGYATPGTVNSQFLGELESEEEITLENEIFSPDNDGYKDEVTVFYKLSRPGFIANVIVFDASGRRIKAIANNLSLGTHGSFTWNGIDEHGRLASVGIYLIFIEVHHPSGEVKQFRKTCVLGTALRR